MDIRNLGGLPSRQRGPGYLQGIGARRAAESQYLWQPPSVLDRSLFRNGPNQPTTIFELDTLSPTISNSSGTSRYTPGQEEPVADDREEHPNGRPDNRQYNRISPTRFIRPVNIINVPTAPREEANDEGYVPMGRWSTWVARRLFHPSIWQQQLAATGISENYGGNIFLASNQSADITEDQSTSLWLTNLPPKCTHQMLLGAIRGCGKVYATVINPPEPSAGRAAQAAPHVTSASKLVFFYRAGVDNLLAQSQAGRFVVGDYVPRLRMNRIRSAPRALGPQCRVLHIEGPGCIVNEAFLNAFFQSKFTYELEAILTLASTAGFTRQEWRFGSFRCQAESARQAIGREKLRRNTSDECRHLWSQVTVHYGVDPCA